MVDCSVQGGSSPSPQRSSLPLKAARKWLEITRLRSQTNLELRDQARRRRSRYLSQVGFLSWRRGSERLSRSGECWWQIGCRSEFHFLNFSIISLFFKKAFLSRHTFLYGCFDWCFFLLDSSVLCTTVLTNFMPGLQSLLL